MYIIERLMAPTPVFFQRLRNAGLLLTALSGILIGSPLSLPHIVITIAGYMGLAGAVMGVVSQLTTESSSPEMHPISIVPVPTDSLELSPPISP